MEPIVTDGGGGGEFTIPMRGNERFPVLSVDPHKMVYNPHEG